MCAANSCERCLPSLSDSPQDATSHPQSRRLHCMRSDSHPWWCEHSISTKHRLLRPRTFNSDLNSHVGFIFTSFEGQPVGSVFFFFLSFDLATRPWRWYLISPHDVATLTCSLIRVHDNAVLICAGRHWLIWVTVFGCFFNFRHFNVRGWYFY